MTEIAFDDLGGMPLKEAAQHVWNSLPKPSTRKVEAILVQRGFTISYRTIARWVKEGWKEEALHDKLAQAIVGKVEKPADGIEGAVVGKGMSDTDLERISSRITELAGKTKAELLEVQEKTRLVMNIVVMEEAARKANIMALIPKDTSVLVESFTDAAKTAPPPAPIVGPEVGASHNGDGARVIEGRATEISPLSQAIRALRAKEVA